MTVSRVCIWLLLSLFCITCTTENPVVLPDLPPPLSGTTPIPEVTKPLMDGVYTVIDGQGRFGREVVVKWQGKNLSIFAETNYLVLETGYKDSLIIMRGYWRVPTSDAVGLIDLIITKEEGARNILSGTPTSFIKIKGLYGNQDNPPFIGVSFQYKRPFSSKVTSKVFDIVAHRGGGRTSDRLPVSENSIEMIGYTERFGSTGIEIDIRLTKDKVPVLYHDSDINIRLTIKGPLNGPIENFTWNQLSTFVRLIRGEQIPRFVDVMNYVIDSTQLRFVWLDVKDPAAVAIIAPIQALALIKAKLKGRDIEILMGVPADDVLAALKALPNYQFIPSLCEISPEETRTLNSRAWAPRWTLGTQNDQVAMVQAEGRKVLTWTIDLPAYIKQFLEEGTFDGLLTNYPSYVAYGFYIQE